MDVELSDATEDLDTVGHPERRAVVESLIQVNKVLAHNIIEYNDEGEAVQECKDPM